MVASLFFTYRVVIFTGEMHIICTGLLAGVKAGRVHLCRVTGTTL